MAESDYARHMRREAEKQTRFASDQAYYAEQAAQQQTEAAIAAHAAALAADRAAEEAAARAWQAEQNSAEQLEMQRQINSEVSNHHFAMWRQTTANGERYERWAWEATPLVEIFNRRWNEWLVAKEADLKTFKAQKKSEADKRFGIDAKVVQRDVGDIDNPEDLRGLIPLALFMPLLFLWVLAWPAGWVYKDLAPSDWWEPTAKFMLQIGVGAMIVVVVCAIIANVWYVPAKERIYEAEIARIETIKRKKEDAQKWYKAELAAFSSGMPSVWHGDGEGYAWEQLRKAADTLRNMPTAYVDFHPQMLTDLSDGLPRPAAVGTIHVKATRTRALISSWS